MTIRCIKCHRSLKHASPDGLGPVCARKAASRDTASSDLFTGVDLDGAAMVARERLRDFVDMLAAREIAAMRVLWGRVA